MKKLKTPKIYGQRDSKWASILLGYNTQSQYNIGMYGCLITSLGNYLDKTPPEVNDILKANNGFTAGSGNFIWNKCEVLGIKQVYLSPYYDGQMTDFGLNKIKECIDNGFPLLCEIDFNPATEGEEMHYVLLNGYDGDAILAIDPWLGQQINLDVYGGAKRAIIQFRQYDRKLEFETTQDNLSEIELLKTQLEMEIQKKNETYKELTEWKDRFSSVCTALGDPIDKDIVLADIEKLKSMEQIANDRQKELDKKTEEIASMEIKIAKLESDKKEIQVQLDQSQKSIIDLGLSITDLGSQVEELKKLKPLKEYSIGELIGQLFLKLIGR